MKKRLVLFSALFALVSIVAFAAADVTGRWVGEATGKGGPPTFTFKQAGSTLTGTSSGRGGDTEISNGKVEGDTISFEVTRDMGDKGKFVTHYKGTVSGVTMKLTAETEGRGSRELVLTKQ